MSASLLYRNFDQSAEFLFISLALSSNAKSLVLAIFFAVLLSTRDRHAYAVALSCPCSWPCVALLVSARSSVFQQVGEQPLHSDSFAFSTSLNVGVQFSFSPVSRNDSSLLFSFV